MHVLGRERKRKFRIDLSEKQESSHLLSALCLSELIFYLPCRDTSAHENNLVSLLTIFFKNNCYYNLTNYNKRKRNNDTHLK